MRALLMGKRKVCAQPVEYYLLVQEFGNMGESYGVEVRCENGEEASVHGITLSQSKILVLISALMDHRVTPTTLRDVVDDWILS